MSGEGKEGAFVSWEGKRKRGREMRGSERERGGEREGEMTQEV